MEVPAACTLPPAGWWCSRDAGHDGPCAARALDDFPRTMPQAKLKALAEAGIILSVMTFEDHMNPKVHWIEPEEFGQAFKELTDGEAVMDPNFEAAFTPEAGSYPPFINAKRGDAPGTVAITVRSPMRVAGHGPDAGDTARIEIGIEDLDQWIADLQRLRNALGG